MELQKTVIQAKPVTLSSEDQQEIITFVKDAWDKGKEARKKYADHWKECENAYHCVMEPIESPELDWMSNICLPWAYDASDSWYAHIHSTTIPKNDQIFTISGRTQEDHPGAEVMQKYLTYRFERNDFARQLGRAEQDLARRNHAVLKVYWREDTTVEYPWVDEPVMEPDPVSGQPMQVGTKKVRKPQEQTEFNNVWIDVIDLENFVMYPIQGDFEKTTRIHETYRHYEDLKASADKTNYFNLDQLSLDDERNTNSNERSDLARQPDEKRTPKGLKIKEAWISRVKIGDTVYRNYIATVVNDKVLVRFQPFPPGCPKSPFVFMALRPDKDCFYGEGLNSKGLGLLKAANKIFNSWQDEASLTVHNSYKYFDDGTLNPYSIVRRPGAMIKMGSIESVTNNLVPLMDDPNKQNQAMQDLAALKVEFETVTVPKVVKGMIDVGRDATATEITQAQNNSSGKMHIDAFHINDYLLQPVLEISYQAIYDRVQLEMMGGEPDGQPILDEIKAVTQPKDANGNPLEELPILPLPEVDIKIVGYQNVIRKQEALQNMGIAIPQLAQSPAARYLKWANLAEDTFQLMDLDKDRLLMNEQERQQADEQASQQPQPEMMTLQLQKEQQDQEFQLKTMELQLKQAELQLKEKEIECKCHAEQQKAEQAAQQTAIQADQGQQQLDQQAHQADTQSGQAQQQIEQQAMQSQQQHERELLKAKQANKGAKKNG